MNGYLFMQTSNGGRNYDGLAVCGTRVDQFDDTNAREDAGGSPARMVVVCTVAEMLAARTMREALAEVLDLFADAVRVAWPSMSEGDYSARAKALASTDKARAAIAKARGEA